MTMKLGVTYIKLSLILVKVHLKAGQNILQVVNVSVNDMDQ